MKKLIFMLGGAVMAGGAIFAIQSYATSTPTLPTDEEIVGLKSTNNNNQLTAIMWDKMLDLLRKVNNRSTSEGSLWKGEWKAYKIKGKTNLSLNSITHTGDKTKLILHGPVVYGFPAQKEGGFLWESGFGPLSNGQYPGVALEANGRIRAMDPLFPSDTVTKRYLEGWLRPELSAKEKTMHDIARAGDSSARHLPLDINNPSIKNELVVGFHGNGHKNRVYKELKAYDGKWYTFCALGGVRYNEIAQDSDSCSCNVYKDSQKGWILTAGAHRGGECAIVCTANCF